VTTKQRTLMSKGTPEVVALSRAERLVARVMAASKAGIPHFYVTADVDVTDAELRRRSAMASDPSHRPPTVTDAIVKATALALRDHPRCNSSYGGETIELYPNINIAIAVAAHDTVVAPVIHGAEALDIFELACRGRELATRVRDGTITPAELDGGTFTVSNLGMYGVSAFCAVITPPQVAALAVGAIREQMMLKEDGQVEVRRIISLTLSSDHRVLTGEHASLFLSRLRELLEMPEALFDRTTPECGCQHRTPIKGL
jgi:pyruvate dehydrogenase E2 component (dihydrolipoamide acetyltransferase)